MKVAVDSTANIVNVARRLITAMRRTEVMDHSDVRGSLFAAADVLAVRNDTLYAATKRIVEQETIAPAEIGKVALWVIDLLEADLRAALRAELVRGPAQVPPGILARHVNVHTMPTRPVVKITRVRPGARLPTYAHEDDAGADLYAYESALVPCGSVCKVPTGVAIELPPGWEAQVRSRSGLASRGVFVANQPGTIDSGYRGEIIVLLGNIDESYQVSVGDRIAQLVIKPCYQARFELVEQLSASDRGTRGMGSTGR